MAMVKAGGLSQTTLRDLERTKGVSDSRIAYALVVQDHLPDLANDVLSGVIYK